MTLLALENSSVAADNEFRPAAYDFALWRSQMKTMQDVDVVRNVARNLIVASDRSRVDVPSAEDHSDRLWRGSRRAARWAGRILAADEQTGAEAVLVIGPMSGILFRWLFIGRPAHRFASGSTVHTIVGRDAGELCFSR